MDRNYEIYEKNRKQVDKTNSKNMNNGTAVTQPIGNDTKLSRSKDVKDMNTVNNCELSGLILTDNSVYEYDMDCLSKNKKCY